MREIVNGLKENRFCKSKAICYTYYLSNEVHQIAKCQSSSKAKMPLLSLSLSLSPLSSKVVYHELVNSRIKIYLIIYTTFTHLKNIFFLIVSTPHYKKGHELKQAFTMLNHKYQMFFLNFKLNDFATSYNESKLLQITRSICQTLLEHSLD